MGPEGYGIDLPVVRNIAQELKELREIGVELASSSAGNIFRGTGRGGGIDRASADYMGMLATIMNAMALQDCLEKAGVHTRVLSAIEIQKVVEPYIRRRATRHLEKDASLSWPQERGTLSSPPTPRPPFAPWRSRPM